MKELDKSIAPNEPSPKDWLTKDRLEKVNSIIHPAFDLLSESGLVRGVLAYWIRSELSLEIEELNQSEKEEFKISFEKWSQMNSSASELSVEQIRKRIRVSIATSKWSSQQWSNRLETLYLYRKESLDSASCRLLRFSDKYLGMELYHRIKAGETTFEQASLKYGEGQERFRGGLIPLQSLEKMPNGLAPILQRLQPGSLSMPLGLNKGFCLVQLVEWKPSQLDEETKGFLLAEQLRYWIDMVVDQLLTELNLSYHKDHRES